MVDVDPEANCDAEQLHELPETAHFTSRLRQLQLPELGQPESAQQRLSAALSSQTKELGLPYGVHRQPSVVTLQLTPLALPLLPPPEDEEPWLELHADVAASPSATQASATMFRRRTAVGRGDESAAWCMMPFVPAFTLCEPTFEGSMCIFNLAPFPATTN